MSWYNSRRDVIVNLRKRRGWSQDDLAAELKKITGKDFSREKIKNWENGEREIKSSDLVLLSRCFGVSTDYLLELSENPTIEGSCREAAEYTGLPEDAVEALHKISSDNIRKIDLELIASLISSDSFRWFVADISGVKYAAADVADVISEQHTLDSLDQSSENLRYQIFQTMESLKAVLNDAFGADDLLRKARRELEE